MCKEGLLCPEGNGGWNSDSFLYMSTSCSKLLFFLLLEVSSTLTGGEWLSGVGLGMVEKLTHKLIQCLRLFLLEKGKKKGEGLSLVIQGSLFFKVVAHL